LLPEVVKGIRGKTIVTDVIPVDMRIAEILRKI